MKAILLAFVWGLLGLATGYKTGQAEGELEGHTRGYQAALNTMAQALSPEETLSVVSRMLMYAVDGANEVGE